MNETAPPAFELPNVGSGPDPCSLSALAAEYDFVVLFFQRDHHCTMCRKQVRQVREDVESYRARDAEPVSILPEPRDRAQQWQDSYELPYPFLADSEAAVADDYGQTVRFGALGAYSDFLGRMPRIVLLDTRDSPGVVWTHGGRSTFDRPSTEEILGVIDSRLSET
jgi:peroxiredoxin Q/BCP